MSGRPLQHRMSWLWGCPNFLVSVNFVYCCLYFVQVLVLSLSLCTHVDTLNKWLCFTSASTHQWQQCSSLALLTATWQAPTLSSHTPHRNPGVTTTVHHQNTERSRNMTHLTLWTLRERGSGADSQRTDIKYCHRRTVQIWKIDWYADFPFLSCWFFCHSLSFYPCLNVAVSLCPRDDSFSDTLSQKADSEASSGHAGEDKCSGKDISSPTDTRISEAYIMRLVWSVGILHCNIEASTKQYNGPEWGI